MKIIVKVAICLKLKFVKSMGNYKRISTATITFPQRPRSSWSTMKTRQMEPYSFKHQDVD